MSEERAASPIAHFAVNADDVERARRFYEAVFGWRFEAWGPPDFYRIDTGATDAAAIGGALQARRTLVEGERTVGFECTVAVDDVAAVCRAAVDGGGRVLMEPTTITGVGELAFLQDPEGNAVGAMRYDADAS
ncbi:MAG: VOC family protein [Actinomycetota bacterium]